MTTSTPAPEGHTSDLSDGTDPTSDATLSVILLPDGEVKVSSRLHLRGPAALCVGGVAVTLFFGSEAGLSSAEITVLAGGEVFLAGFLAALQKMTSRRKDH